MHAWEPLLFASIVLFALLGPLLFRRARRIWFLRNVPGPSSVSFITGSTSNVYSEDALAYQERLFLEYGRVYKIGGFLGDPQLVISDPRVLSHILIREADAFELPGWFMEGNHLVFGPTVVSTAGSRHGAQRRLLAPVFGSSENVKRQTLRIREIVLELKQVMTDRLRDSDMSTVDVQDLFTRLSLECIAQAALGHSFHSFKTDHPFLLAMKEFVPVYATVLPIGVLALGSGFSTLPTALLRTAAAFLRVVRPSFGNLLNTVQAMHTATAEVWDEKKRLYAEDDEKTLKHVREGRDLLSVLLKAYMSTDDKLRATEEEVLAHIRVTMFAGSDTTASALSRTIQLLTEHVDVQDALRAELTQASSDVDVTALPLLDAICRETLRLYPPAQISQRVALKDTMAPLIDDQRGLLHIPKGTQILLNIRGSNTDTEIWGPDGAEWRPSRWLEPLPSSVQKAHVPGVYANTLTFLGGGRACIGYRFSQLVMKTTLATIIPSFQFTRVKADIEWRYCGVVTPATEGWLAL